MEIRRAKVEDAAAIGQVQTFTWQSGYRGLFRDEYLDSQRWEDRADYWRGEMEKATPGEHVFVADADGAVVGFASMAPTDDGLELDCLYVLAEHWGTGAGWQLLETILERAEGRPVHLWVIDDNARARRFYERQGMHHDGGEQVVERDGSPVRLLRYSKIEG